MTILWPLLGLPPRFPQPGVPGDEEGQFAFVRKHEIHTGVDLYCAEKQPVVAVDDGFFVQWVKFTGPEAGSPWWEPTSAVIIAHDWGVMVYGEIVAGRKGTAHAHVSPSIKRGDIIGYVKRVRPLKVGDPRPTTMLHVELWRDRAAVLWCYQGKRSKEAADWPLGFPRPEGLLDPMILLADAAKAVEAA
jgi:hypothetical protein